MTVRLVYASRCTSTTGRALAARISQDQGRAAYYYCGRAPRRRRSRRPVDCVIWGCSTCTESLRNAFGSAYRACNDPYRVAIASDKNRAIGEMRLGHVLCPDIFTTTAWASVPDNYDGIIYRKRSHQGGNDNPYVVRKGDSIDSARAGQYDYGMQFVKSNFEYRIHVCDRKVIRVQRKRKMDGAYEYGRIRSESNGWGLAVCEDRTPEQKASALAVQAVASLGLVFGAVDVIGKNSGELYVLEVNTAPGLNDNGIAIYSKALIEYFNER